VRYEKDKNAYKDIAEILAASQTAFFHADAVAGAGCECAVLHGITCSQ
jgi:hypothetical protein